MSNWKDDLTERELKEIVFCRLYAERFNHGTDGHNIRLIVAKLSDLLDEGATTRTNTGGGGYIRGNANTGGAPFVGRDLKR